MLQAQKQDYVWVIGHDKNSNDSIYGGTVINFNGVPPKVDYFEQGINMNMYVANASVCDSSGKLLFYTNGCDISDGTGAFLENGRDLNPGYWHTRLCDEIARGYSAGFPDAVILPLPGIDNVYYLFHKSVKYVPGPPEDAFVDKLLYTVINTSTGEKLVLQKNAPVMEDALAVGETVAVKHANGVDWWLITPRRNSNRFYVFLFTADGIVDTLTQTIGDLPPPQEEGSGQTNMAPDGSLMVRYFSEHPAMLYDFNRATGLFSNYRTININFGSTLAFDGGCAFSPSGRYLYIMALLKAYQFDLWAADISVSQTTVAEWDGFLGPLATAFVWSQLGPDCKIYIQCGDMQYYHVIHNPDEPGLACNFEQRGLVLPTPSGASIPYFPNYRLGPVDNPGQPCTPTLSVTAGPALRLPALRAWPNPASRQLSLEWGQELSGPVRISLYDVYGRAVKTAVATAGAGAFTLPLGDLPPGMYWYALRAETGAALGGGPVAVHK